MVSSQKLMVITPASVYQISENDKKQAPRFLKVWKTEIKDASIAIEVVMAHFFFFLLF